MPIQEEDWGQDINLEEGQFFQKNGIFNLEPDKDLMLACERYMDNNPYHTYLDDDATNSSVCSFATGSFISSRYSTTANNNLTNIDEYILNISPPPSMSNTTSTSTHHVTKYTGTIKRLVGAHYKQVQDNEDWNDDIEIPATGITPKHFQDLPSSSMLDEFDDDDVGPSISQRGSVHASTFYSYEREEDDNDMNGLDFPENLLSLHQKLDERKKVEYETSIPKNTSSSRIPVFMKSSSPILSTIQREKEDDDILEGLDIKDLKLFKPKSTPLQRTSKRPSAIPLTTRLTRPQVKEKPKLAQKTLPPRRNFLASTQSSLNREAEIRQKQQKPRLTHTKPSSSMEVEKQNASGYILIQRPKTKIATNYCARLDSIDNLNDLAPKKKITFRSQLPADPKRPWRQNMQSVIKKPTLIQPNQQPILEYNDMKYDEKTHQWKGNETSLAGFEQKPQRKSRLMLMSHKQHNKPSKYTAMMGNNMIFKPELQKWVSALGTECNELDAIEDLEEVPKKPKKEYHLSKEVKRQMLMEQQEHEDFMSHWPLDPVEPQLTTNSGHKVAASKYFLKIHLF